MRNPKRILAFALVLIMSIAATSTVFARGGFGGGRGAARNQGFAGQAQNDNSWRGNGICRFDCISFGDDGNIVPWENLERGGRFSGRIGGQGVCPRLQ